MPTVTVSERRPHEERNADQRAPARGMPHRHRRRRRPRGAVRRADQPRELHREHLQGQDRQPRAGDPGRVRRLLGRPQRLPARLRRRAAVLPPAPRRRGRARRDREPGATATTAAAAARPTTATRSARPRPASEDRPTANATPDRSERGPPRPLRAPPVRRGPDRRRLAAAAPAPPRRAAAAARAAEPPAGARRAPTRPDRGPAVLGRGARVRTAPRARAAAGRRTRGAPRPGRAARLEPFDPDLPPSRTQRSAHPAPAAPARRASTSKSRAASGLAPRPLDVEPEPEPEPPRAREREPPAAARPRPRRPGRRPEPEAPFEPEAEPEPIAAEPEPSSRADRASAPSRPGAAAAGPPSARAAASASPNAETARPRADRRAPTASRAAERAPRAATERRRAPSADRPPSSRPSGPGSAPATRAPGRRSPSARERGKPHDRAGEPGYVPRRERYRGPEPTFGPEPPPARLRLAGPRPRGRVEATRDRGRARRGRAGRARQARRARAAAAAAGAAAASASGPSREAATARARRRASGPDLEDEDGLEPAPDLEPRGPAPGRRRSSTRTTLLDEFDFGDEPDVEDVRTRTRPRRAPRGGRPRTSPSRTRSTPSSRRRSAARSRRSPSSSARWASGAPIEARPRRGDEREAEPGGRGGRFPRGRGMAKPPIQEIFRRGDEVLVQVIKESIGTKGPTLSTYISIPGRYLVLMPGLNRVGVSRKIADEGQRRKLREIMNELNPPKGLGFIVRTAGLDRTKRELARDLAYLLRLWKVILRRIKKAKAPAPIYQESDMITRTIRDIFTSEIDTIWIDEPSGLRARPGVPPGRHAQVRQPPQALRREGAAVPQVRHRGRDRQDPAPARRRCPRAARSSSTRPRRWSPSTSTGATSGSRTTPSRPPTR